VRRRILGVAVLAVVLAVSLFGLPLGYAVHKVYYYDEHSELERIALRAALQVSADLPDVGKGLSDDGDVAVSVYGPDRRRLSGNGPDLGDAAVATSLTGAVADERIGSDMVVAVPIYARDRVVAVARAASAASAVQSRVFRAWGLLAGIALLAGLSSSALAARQSRRLAVPLVRLEEVAEELGDGNFAVRAAPSGVTEIDRAGAALNRTAERLDDILARERNFSALASHQLRTPLTDLRLGLESALGGPDDKLRAAATEAIGGADRLAATIDDVLALARGGASGELLELTTLLDGTRLRWFGPLRAAGRALVIVQEDPPAAQAAPAAVRQILDLLVDNALQHGLGTVTVTARSSSGALAIDVADEGTTATSLVPPPDAPGGAPRRLGLALAAALADAQAGRLVHARTDPTTRLTLLLPAADPVNDDEA
jgi:signal transduction histidine kinase